MLSDFEVAAEAGPARAAAPPDTATATSVTVSSLLITDVRGIELPSWSGSPKNNLCRFQFVDQALSRRRPVLDTHLGRYVTQDDELRDTPADPAAFDRLVTGLRADLAGAREHGDSAAVR